MAHNPDTIPIWTWAIPAAATVVLALKMTGLVPSNMTALLIAAGLLLAGSVFAAVHHAEVLAIKLGEPFGSILLALAVTIIEVGLIVSILLSGAPGSEHVARDTIYATVMIVLNGVVGLCLVLGARRHFEQTFQLQGATSALAVVGTLATITLILPNYTVAAAGPYFSNLQLAVIGAMSLILWSTFVFVQTVKHQYFFVDDGDDTSVAEIAKPSDRVAWISLVLLLCALTGVVLLAKILSDPLAAVVSAAGLPQAFVGVVIAAIVLLPEGMAAVKSALGNRLQNSINLSVGSAIASIGLTIPAVAIVAIVLNKNVSLGISPAGVTLLVLTLFVSTLTLGTGRTTVLQGAIHLTIFAVFLLVAAIP